MRSGVVAASRTVRIRRAAIVKGERVGEWNWMVCDSCLTEIESSGEQVRCPHCGAVFHGFCYEALKRSKGKCPKCRIEIE
ncbi:MAG: hypothetical protein ABDH63_05735 [Candidatus Caldarchaeales archaeon]